MPVTIKPSSGAGSVTLEAQTGISSNFTLTLPGVTATLNTSGAVNVVPAGTVSAPSITTTGDTNTGIYFPAADTIGFVEGGVESMRLDASGNLGLGATSLPARLNGKTLSINGTVLAASYQSGIELLNNGSSGGEIWYNTAQGMVINSYANLPIGFRTNNALAMTLDASGNLGVGSTTPTGARLYINGGSLFTGSPGSYGVGVSGSLTSGRIGTYGTTTASVINSYFDDSTIEISAGVTSGFVTGISITARSGSAYGDTIRFVTRGTGTNEAARIDSSGRLLVGTTTFTGSRLTVTGPANATIPYVAAMLSNASGDLDYATLLLSKFDNNNGVGQVFLRFAINNNSTANGQINGNGASQAAFGSWSDARLKENIVDLPPQLANILSLRPVEFDYIASEGGGHQISFIAQDFDKVYPDAVGERDDGMKTLTGWGKTEARLVKAIQELAAKVTALEDQLNG